MKHYIFAHDEHEVPQGDNDVLVVCMDGARARDIIRQLTNQLSDDGQENVSVVLWGKVDKVPDEG